MKQCLIKNANEEKLYELIKDNLDSLDKIIEYNIKNKINFFRISSDLIPFASSEVNKLLWWDIFKTEFEKIKKKINLSNMRISMHPGQYTVLNSFNEDIVTNAIKDLDYHALVLDLLNDNNEGKIILHIGGVYGDKEKAIERFISNYQRLNERVKRRLIIENDDKLYNIEDVLRISEQTGILVVFDNLHHEVNPPDNKDLPITYWQEKAFKTWEKDGNIPKSHYSQQDYSKKAGSHSPTIRISEFITYYNQLVNKNVDIMLEVKDKNLSTIKVNNCLYGNEIKLLEEEWSRYKYLVLEKSPSNYQKIRELLKDKNSYPAVEFYTYLENSLEMETVINFSVNAIEHVWGYFKNIASKNESNDFKQKLNKYKKGELSLASIKSSLKKLAAKYSIEYLLNSYYFLD